MKAREVERKLMNEETAVRKYQEPAVPEPSSPPIPPAAPAAPPPAAPAPAETPATQAPKSGGEAVTYVVQRGDTLWKIAKMEEHFGQGHRWYDIWKANEDKIEDFDRLSVGESLEIPRDKPEGYPWPRTRSNIKARILSKESPSAIPPAN